MAQAERNTMSVGAGQSPDTATSVPRGANTEINSPIQGMSLELYNTLSKRHSFDAIQKQRDRYKTHEDFLADAAKEAEHIRFTLAKQAANETQSVSPKPLSVGQEVNGKKVEETVLENAQLWDTKRQEAAAKLLYGEGKELSDKQKQELIEAHWEAAGEKGRDEESLASVYNLTREQIRREAEKLSSFTTEERRKLFEAGLVGPATSFEKLKAAAKRSKMKEAAQTVIYAMEPGARELMASEPAVDTFVKDKRKTLEAALYPTDQIKQKELECVLYFATDRIGKVYTEAMRETPKIVSDWATPREPPTLEEKIHDVNKALDNFEERFWTYGLEAFKRIFEEAGLPAPDEAKLAQLREEYNGIASLVASRAGVAIVKELNGIKSPIPKDLEQELIAMPAIDRRARIRQMAEYQKIENIGEFFLIDAKGELNAISGERAMRRREMRKRATARERLHYSDYRERFDFLWAETAEELEDSIDDYLDIFSNALPEKAEDLEYQDVQDWVRNALSAHTKALNNIGLDPASVVAEAQRDKIQSHMKKIAGARMVDKRKGMEYFLKLKQDLASKYDAYEDATYLGEGYAIMADKIAEHDGAYYKSGPPNVHKPLPGETKVYRDKIRREAIEYGATHQLYITKEDFDRVELGEEEITRQVVQEVVAYNRDPKHTKKLTAEDVEKRVKQRMEDKKERNERGGRYGWEDPIEDLLLEDRRGIAAASELTDPERTEALVKVKLRTDVFKGIKIMLDKIDGLHGLAPEQRRQKIRDRIRDAMDERKVGERRKEIDGFDEEASETYVRLYQGLQRNNLSPAQIRTEIDRRMVGDPTLLQKIQDEIQAAKDKALWEWVEEYNRPKLAMKENASNALPWFPSLWDEERLMIRRPEDLIDRELTPEEFRAMVEKIDDPYEGMTDKQISRQIREGFAASIKREVSAKGLAPEQEQEEYKKSLEEREQDIEDKIKSELFKRKQRLTKAIRNFNLNVDDDKFKGLEARWGGLTSRVVNKETGELELTTIYKEAFAILKAKKEIDKQAVELELTEWEEGYEATYPGKTIAGYKKNEREQIKEYEKNHPGVTLNAYDWEEIKWRKEFKDLNPDLTPAQYDEYARAWRIGYKAVYNPTDDELKEAKDEQRRLLRRNHTMATILGLEEIGLADYLPVALYYGYSDESLIGALSPLVGYTDDDKGELPELLDRPRREMEAVWYFMGEQHMDGKVLEVVDRKPGLIVKDKNGKVKPAHEERWVRARVINPGGNLKLRGIFEKMFMISTSGGVEVTPLARKIGQLGVWDEGLENGQEDKLRLHGFRKRRCRWEYRQQSFFNLREYADPLTYVDRLAGAVEAIKYLTGGEVQGKGHIPGALIEPMSGAYKYRDMFLDAKTWLEQKIRNIPIDADQRYKEQLLRALSEEKNVKQIHPEVLDKLTEIGAGIMKPLIDFMDAQRYLMNRAGLAPKNWKYNNELIVNAYLNELFNEDIMGGKDLGYAPEGRSPIAVKIFREILKTSTYHILVERDREVLYPQGQETKIAMDKQRSGSAVSVLPQNVQAAITPTIDDKRKTVEDKQEEQKAKIDKKRQQLEAKEVAQKAELDKKRQELQKQNKPQEEIEKEIDVLGAKQYEDNKSLVEEIDELGKPLYQEQRTVEDEIAELIDAKISTLVHEQVETAQQQLAAGNAVINPIALNLPPDILKMLNARWKFLIDHHIQGKTKKKDGLKRIKPGTPNIEAELKRLLDQYLDTKLHMEFVGEWPARLLAA